MGGLGASGCPFTGFGSLIAGAIARPVALAVRTSSVNTQIVGISIGISEARSPRRILSTNRALCLKLAPR
jgi:hypothetical protein